MGYWLLVSFRLGFHWVPIGIANENPLGFVWVSIGFLIIATFRGSAALFPVVSVGIAPLVI